MNKSLKFFEKVGKLKKLCRTGWMVRGIVDAETVGDHSWGMALMAILKEQELKRLNVNVPLVIKMCLLHDVGECVIGDIMPEEYQTNLVKISKNEKKNIEYKAIDDLALEFDFYKLKEIFVEYEEQKTLEAVVVKNLDKLDMILQAYEYILKYKNSSLGEFMQFNEKEITLDVFKNDLREIKRRQFDNVVEKNEFIDFQLKARELKSIKKQNNNCSLASSCFLCGIIAIYFEDELIKLGIDADNIIKYLIVKDIDKKLINDELFEKIKISDKEASVLNDIEVLENICLKDEIMKKYLYNLFLKFIN